MPVDIEKDRNVLDADLNEKKGDYRGTITDYWTKSDRWRAVYSIIEDVPIWS